MKPSQLMPVKKKRPEIVLEEKHYKPIRGLQAWLKRQHNRWHFCSKCLVVRPLKEHLAHRWIHKPGSNKYGPT